MTDPESITPDTTIGIGHVFLEPPPFVATSSEQPSPFRTWEIVGIIKSCPEDFVVREIASRKRTPKLPKEFDLVADLAPSDAGAASVDTASPVQESDDDKAPTTNVTQQSHNIESNKGGVKPSAKPTAQKSKEPSVSPSDIVNSILVESFGKEKASEIVGQIGMVQRRALACLEKYSTVAAVDDSNHVVWIPPLPTATEDSSLDNDNRKSHRGGNRGHLHRNLKLVFPLLQTETVLREETGRDEASAGESEKAETEKHPWIRVSIDDTFFGLAASLYRPQDDIPLLYSFRNQGCLLLEVGQQTHGKKRKRGRDDTPTDDGSVVFLRLRPDLSRDERRPLHHLISKAYRDFETSTISNYCTSEESQDIAAIVVKWSNRAQQRAKKKNCEKSCASKADSSGSSVNTLCVLQKTQTEHLSAVKRLARAIRCRQSDIGLAGIKDMHAVTFQFCTIANVSPKRVERANSSLKSQGIELGRIQEVDWVLNQGDLQGNRFDIVIRQVKRIEVRCEEGVQSEVRVPCEREHIRAMARRVNKSGFINFYGEQRLGTPGRTSDVGVRPFDIGRALLQQDFAKAIDLLMTGRLVCAGEDGIERADIRQARKVWRETNGDAEKTLKAMPSGDAMARERTVLQGLKRYGSQEPLAALKCLHISVRSFWINAYQSFVWNSMASERLKRFGTKVVKGDLYRLSEDEGRAGVRVVTDDASTIDIANVVLPLPGYAVQYPDNEIGELFRHFLAKENVSFDRSAPSEATAKGSYRPLIAFAHNLEVDFDSIEGNDASASETEQDTVAAAFKLEFDLPSGSYATMLLRELMLTTIVR